MCALAGVSRAGYYRHLQASAPRQEETIVRDAIQRVALEQRHYGYRRITWHLRYEGLVVNHKRVLNIMRQDNLLCMRKKPFVPMTTLSRHKWRVVPNLARNLELTGIDQLWVADITYVATREGFLYLAFILDVHSRRIVGWAMENHLRTELVVDALRMAVWRRKPAPGLVHHSDQGVQYTSLSFSERLKEVGITPSMGTTGSALDNAMAESFVSTLKVELVSRMDFPTRQAAKTAVFEYLETFYNTRRLHSSLGYRSPADFEEDKMEEARVS
jgi:transposase InsO family protein